MNVGVLNGIVILGIMESRLKLLLLYLNAESVGLNYENLVDD